MAKTNTNVVIIDGNPYDVEIYLIKGCTSTGVIPIAYSSLKYLEISNDLANIGYTGKIIFTNFNNILEKLNVFAASNNAPILYFKLRSLSFGDEKSTYDDIFFFAALTEGQDFKQNAIDGNSAYNFEELYVFNLKTSKVIKDNLYLKSFFNNSVPVYKLLRYLLTFNEEVPSVFDQTPQFLSPSIRSNKTLSISTLSASDNHILREIEVAGEPAGDSIALTPIVNLNNTTVFYDAIKSLYPYFSFLPKGRELKIDNENWYDPGMIKIENDRATNGARKIIMFPLLGTIQNFFDTVSKEGSKTSGVIASTADNYYNNIFLTEKFVIAQSDSAEYLSDNTVDKYELKRVNYNDVLKNKKWVTTECREESRDGCTSGSIRPYLKTRQVFEQICVSPYPCNLPEIPEGNESVKVYQKPDININLALAYGTNTVLKSFVFDNLAVVFRVKGQPYRKPNRFISLNPQQLDKKSGDKFNEKNKEEISGYWYVVSVNHIFENGNYFNEFTCVKLYDLNSSVSNQQNSNVGTPGINSTGSAPNGGEEITSPRSNPQGTSTNAPAPKTRVPLEGPVPNITRPEPPLPEGSGEASGVLLEFLDSGTTSSPL
jgi:hypothetical protein